MGDALTYLVAFRQFAFEQWMWIALGVVVLFLLWYRGAASPLPPATRKPRYLS